MLRQTLRNSTQLAATVLMALVLFTIIYGVATMVPTAFNLKLGYAPALSAAFGYLVLMYDIVSKYSPQMQNRIREEILDWIFYIGAIFLVEIVYFGVQHPM